MAPPAEMPERSVPAPGRFPAGAFLRRAANATAALVLIILGLPLFLLIALVILVVDGRPVLHRGTRLGLRKRPYTMYKFRTLTRDASNVIGPGLVSFRHRVMIPCGKFLRDTRLDELPQLFNILKGDMNFVGPRPVRPEVYDVLCRHLRGYDRRFTVKPGLIGFSQLFTPHSSPKRLRALADNQVTDNSHHPLRDALFVAYTVGAVTLAVTTRTFRWLRDDVLKSWTLGRKRNRRDLVRMRPGNARALIDVGNGRTLDVPVVDINESALLVECPERLDAGSDPLALRIEVRFRRRRRPSRSRTRIANCTGRVSQIRQANGGWRHVLVYNPLTEWNQYLIDQYVLRGSLGCPFR